MPSTAFSAMRASIQPGSSKTTAATAAPPGTNPPQRQRQQHGGQRDRIAVTPRAASQATPTQQRLKARLELVKRQH